MKGTEKSMSGPVEVRTKAILLLVSLLLLWGAPASAERYAVLVGVREYRDPALNRLVGPVNDVRSLTRMLTEKYGFPEQNVTTLVDGDATRRKILDALSQLPGRTKPGDFIFVYFSGHGTSAFDPALGLPMGDATGALIPHDFTLNRKDAQATLAGAIVGKRDLKPIFAELDNGRKVLAVFDACFSEHAVRSVEDAGIPKQVPLSFDEFDREAPPEIAPLAPEPYPYRNVIYIAASGEAERAVDLRQGRFDGKAHGALTDALLMGLDGRADLNHDGTISYEEIYQYSKATTNSRSGQSPQLYRSESLALTGPVFEKQAPQGGTRPEEPPAPKLRVKIEGKEKEPLAARIKALPGAEVVEGECDLLVRADGTRWTLLLPGGEVLGRMDRIEDAVARVKIHAAVRELVRLKNPQQHFNVWLRAGEAEGKAVFREGEVLNFTIRSERDAHLLLLNVDAEGNVCILLPENERSEPRIAGGGQLRTKDIGIVRPPLGVEFLKLFAFKEKVAGLEEFTGGNGVLSPGGTALPRLIELIHRQKDWAETAHQIVTVRKE